MHFWSSETVKKHAPAEGLIDPFDPVRVMRGAYELSVGPEAYVTCNSGEKTALGGGERILIPPGQFGLLVTKEDRRGKADAASRVPFPLPTIRMSQNRNRH